MALVLRLEHRKLGQSGKRSFDQMEKGNVKILVPAMVLAEVGYLSERKRIETGLEEFEEYCQKYPTISVAAITKELIYKTFFINDIPELHDRIIAATALLYGLELITNDPVIQESEFVTAIW